MPRTRRACAALLALLLLASSQVGSEEPAQKSVTEEDRAAVRAVIEAQIEAFRHDDAEKAFSYAAPAIQELFAPPERFLKMVREVYPPVYRPQSVKFMDLEIVAGEYTQRVLLVGPNGTPVLALFLMDKRPDGAWKVLGCVLHPVDGNTT